MRRSASLLSLLVLAVTAACDPGVQVLAQHPLVLEDGSRDGFVGVSRDPATGEVLLLNAREGLFTLGNDGIEELVALDVLLASAEVPPMSDFTDVAALGGGVFALTALSDGFLFDGERLTQHFCYEPGFEGGGEPWPDPVPTDPNDKQLTLSLEFLPESDRLLAQPRTFDASTGELLAAHVATFDLESGEEQAWFDLGDRDLLAGGLTVLDDDSVVLGAGTRLLRFDMGSRELTELADLGGEVRDIAGLARGDDDVLLVIDGENGSLLEVRLPPPR